MVFEVANEEVIEEETKNEQTSSRISQTSFSIENEISDDDEVMANKPKVNDPNEHKPIQMVAGIKEINTGMTRQSNVL